VPSTPADMLAELLDALRIASADVLVNHTGGKIAQTLCRATPELRPHAARIRKSMFAFLSTEMIEIKQLTEEDRPL
jgi:molybdopterin-guanine dinucleotide biosynthesis protein A